MTAYSEMELPSGPGDARETAIFNYLVGGSMVPLTWVAVATESKGHSATLFVTSDVIKLGSPDDYCRATVTQLTGQRLADHYNAVLPTAKISDLVHEQATVVLGAMPQSKWVEDGTMADTFRMAEYSQMVDALRAGRCGLVDTVGKDWVNTNRLEAQPERSANYGWHDPGALYQAATAAGGKVWQPVGLAPNLAHTDYSQSIRLVRRWMIVDGSEMDIEDVARDPELCWLVSSEGVMAQLRHPAVPRPGEEEEPAKPDPDPETPPPAVPIFTRTLRRGMSGDDVAAWQQIAGVTADGIFGANTESATKTWQAEHGLAADGIVGPMTQAAAMDELSDEEKQELIDNSPDDVTDIVPVSELDEITTVLAANYTPANRKAVRWVVFHSMEASEKPSTAEAVANWFAGKSGPPPKASAHYNIDCDSIVRSVPEVDVAWHAPGANSEGIGLEHAGYARQTEAEWLDDYSSRMLWLSARLCADICKRWGIPVEYVDAEGLKAGRGGITTHADVSAAFKKSNHYDPGKDFPMEEYLRMVRESAE